MTDNNKQQLNQLLKIDEIASFLGLPASRIRYEVFRKRIPFIKIGRSVRFDLNEINAWLNKKRKEALDEN